MDFNYLNYSLIRKLLNELYDTCSFYVCSLHTVLVRQGFSQVCGGKKLSGNFQYFLLTLLKSMA